MRKFSVLLLVLLGIIIIAAGTLEVLREADVLTLSLRVFAPLLVVVLGLWIVACASECRTGWYQSTEKS